MLFPKQAVNFVRFLSSSLSKHLRGVDQENPLPIIVKEQGQQ
jgi:hypothetical protein